MSSKEEKSTPFSDTDISRVQSQFSHSLCPRLPWNPSPEAGSSEAEEEVFVSSARTAPAYFNDSSKLDVDHPVKDRPGPILKYPLVCCDCLQNHVLKFDNFYPFFFELHSGGIFLLSRTRLLVFPPTLRFSYM